MATRSTAVGRSPGHGDERPAAQPSRETSPDLGLIDYRTVAARTRRRQARGVIALASVCVALPLVLAAVGHAVVASDQVRSDVLQTEVAQALQTQQDYQLQRSELVAGARVLAIAESRLHMVTPASVTYLAPVNPGESVAQAHEPRRAATAAHRASATGANSRRGLEGANGSDSAP